MSTFFQLPQLIPFLFGNRLGSILLTNFLAVIAICFTSEESKAAETVVLKYGILRESISVAELSSFTETGELSPSLKVYLAMANQKPEKLHQVLSKKVNVSPIFLSQILNSFPGEIVLDFASEVIRTPSGRASRESLRGAMVTSALADGNITLMELLENYPTPEIHVEGERLLEIYNQINQVTKQLPKIRL